MKYQAVDFLNLDEFLTDEQKQIREMVRSFVDDEVMPIIARYYREGDFPRELVPQMSQLGILGCIIDGYECAGLGPIEYGLIMQELERGDSGIRSFASVQTSLCMLPIYLFGSEDQKQKYLPGMSKGEIIGCFGLSEPDFGSNPAGMLTTAVRSEEGFVLNGMKRWITNGNIADIAIVWAKLDEKVQGFVVPTKTKGMVIKEIEGKLSLRASITSEIRMENCVVSAECLLPEAKGLRSAFECLNSARYGIAWGAVGAAMACYDEAVQYSKEREMFGSVIGQKQLVQSKLVWMCNEITKAQLMSLRLGQLKEKGTLQPQHISLAKMNNVGRALEIARLARDVLGANGIVDEYQAMRHMCNLESVNTYEGTYDIHQLIVGEKITGLAAY